MHTLFANTVQHLVVPGLRGKGVGKAATVMQAMGMGAAGNTQGCTGHGDGSSREHTRLYRPWGWEQQGTHKVVPAMGVGPAGNTQGCTERGTRQTVRAQGHLPSICHVAGQLGIQGGDANTPQGQPCPQPRLHITALGQGKEHTNHLGVQWCAFWRMRKRVEGEWGGGGGGGGGKHGARG